LKLWFVLRRFGLVGLRALLRRHLELAAALGAWIAADERFELVAPVTLNLVCFRYRGSDAQNQRLQRLVNDSGRLFISHTVLNGQHVLRFCVGQGATGDSHVRAAWQQIAHAVNDLNI